MTTRNPLVVINGVISELPVGDSLVGAAVALVADNSAGTDSIPSGYQRIVVGDYSITGTLDIEGALILI